MYMWNYYCFCEHVRYFTKNENINDRDINICDFGSVCVLYIQFPKIVLNFMDIRFLFFMKKKSEFTSYMFET